MREEQSPHRIRARARSRLLAHHLGSPANRQGGMTGEYFRIISRPILTYSQKNGELNDINAQYSRSCRLLSFLVPSGVTKERYVYTASARAAARPLAFTESRAILYRHRASFTNMLGSRERLLTYFARAFSYAVEHRGQCRLLNC